MEARNNFVPHVTSWVWSPRAWRAGCRRTCRGHDVPPPKESAVLRAELRREMLREYRHRLRCLPKPGHPLRQRGIDEAWIVWRIVRERYDLKLEFPPDQ